MEVEELQFPMMSKENVRSSKLGMNMSVLWSEIYSKKSRYSKPEALSNLTCSIDEEYEKLEFQTSRSPWENCHA